MYSGLKTLGEAYVCLGALSVWGHVGRDMKEGPPAWMLLMLIATAIIPSLYLRPIPTVL